MFVRGIVRPKIAAEGRVMGPNLSRKWMCPMHPEIVKNASGICDICQMALVTARSLGYGAPPDRELEMPLVIPATAPLITGERAVVYVEVPHSDRPTFEGREIKLGPRAGDFYIVNDGLEEGERVVTSGNFKIDSALQIQAKESMMLPRDHPVSGHSHEGGGNRSGMSDPLDPATRDEREALRQEGHAHE
jgi:Cu(I)/Ag(I) efflux system membrane fusion protein